MPNWCKKNNPAHLSDTVLQEIISELGNLGLKLCYQTKSMSKSLEVDTSKPLPAVGSDRKISFMLYQPSRNIWAGTAVLRLTSQLFEIESFMIDPTFRYAECRAQGFYGDGKPHEPHTASNLLASVCYVYGWSCGHTHVQFANRAKSSTSERETLFWQSHGHSGGYGSKVRTNLNDVRTHQSKSVLSKLPNFSRKYRRLLFSLSISNMKKIEYHSILWIDWRDSEDLYMGEWHIVYSSSFQFWAAGLRYWLRKNECNFEISASAQYLFSSWLPV